MGRRVALKVINAAYSQDESFRQRLFREAQTAGPAPQPHVVPVHSCGEIDGRLFIDMRLIEGTDVGALLRRTRARWILPAPSTWCHKSRQHSRAAHAQSIVPGCRKPCQHLADETGDFAYLVDFGGQCRWGHAADAGAARRSAPRRTWRQSASREDAGAAGDVYALACVLFECVTGSPLFAGNAPSVINGHLSSPVPAASGASARSPEGS